MPNRASNCRCAVATWPLSWRNVHPADVIWYPSDEDGDEVAGDSEEPVSSPTISISEPDITDQCRLPEASVYLGKLSRSDQLSTIDLSVSSSEDSGTGFFLCRMGERASDH